MLTAATNAARNASYSAAGTRGCRLPMYMRVVEQALPVGADVQHDRQGPARVDAGRRGVDGELADGDAHAADAPVADAEDRAGVGGDDQVHVVAAEAGRPQRLLDQLRLVDRQVDAARAPVLVAVVLDRLADGRACR